MSDITNAIEQDQIADSLLGDPEPSEYDQTLDGNVIDQGDEEYASEYEEGEFEQQEGDERDQINAELQAELEQIEREEYLQQQAEQEGQQPQQELSPEQVHESIQQLDQQVNDLQLVDPAESAILASAVGIDPANSAPLAHVMAKTALSVANMYEQTGGDPSLMPQIHPQAAAEFTADFCRSLGVDPRMSGIDPQHLTQVVLEGAWSFADAVATHGPNASLETLNSAEASQWFADNLIRALGGNGGAGREAAIKLADSAGRYFLSVWARRPPPQEEAQPQGRGQRSRSRFQSNQDLFDDEAEAYYRREHGKL